MAHELERGSDGVWHMAYTGEVPWHGLGKKVPHDLTPQQMAEAAGADWRIYRKPLTYTPNGDPDARYDSGRDALLRETDDALMDIVTRDWNEIQNEEAFEFFNDWVSTGEMSMETAGVLRGGQIVWALAKTHDSIELFRKDKIDSYMLFTNPHMYGWTASVSWSAIRVVCMNTLVASLTGTQKDKVIKISHRRKFDADEVKATLGVAKEKLAKYKVMANHLGSKKASTEDVIEYFKRVFPVLNTPGTRKDPERKVKEISKNAKIAFDILETQPGAEFARGTWWQPFNAVTFLLDHTAGRNDDNRLYSAWYGENRRKKFAALELATEYAEAGDGVAIG